MHTKEPWKTNYRRITPVNGKQDGTEDVCHVYGDEFRETANAARIVACVNACAGIKDPAAIRELVTAAKGAMEELKLLEVHCGRNGIAVNVAAMGKLAAAIAKVEK